MTKRMNAAFIAAAAALAVVISGPAGAADISCSTAKLIVPWKPGGGTDVIFRVIAEAVNKAGAKPQIQVVNIAGQGGNKGAKEAVKAKPDGCTLFAIHQSAMTSYLNGRVDFTWDAFEPVAMVTHTPSIIGANKGVPYEDVAGLVDNAKKNPGKVLAGGTLGSTSHFIFILLEDAAGIKLKHISYDGTRERMTALLAENIQVGEINVTAAQKYIASKELKALGIATAERDPRVSEVKTLKEQGIDLVFGLDRGVMLPKGTPADIVKHHEAALSKAMNDPAVKAALEGKGSSVRYLGSADYRKHLAGSFEELKTAAIKVGLYKQ
ncbi:MAG: tripartite tricarboxylate transporter substrate binding protein [Alphaproteobacteria bacterium]|nr:tripartite tricarboxylate transporter substrate binding protein [Alphaproteobacteria bacterium]